MLNFKLMRFAKERFFLVASRILKKMVKDPTLKCVNVVWEGLADLAILILTEYLWDIRLATIIIHFFSHTFVLHCSRTKNIIVGPFKTWSFHCCVQLKKNIYVNANMTYVYIFRWRVHIILWRILLFDFPMLVLVSF